MCGVLNYILGEEKFVTVKVTPKNKNEVVVINSATFELADTQSGEIVQSGAGEIEGDTVSIFLVAEKKGFFNLKVTVKVGKETFKDSINVRVDEA